MFKNRQTKQTDLQTDWQAGTQVGRRAGGQTGWQAGWLADFSFCCIRHACVALSSLQNELLLLKTLGIEI